MVSSESWIVIIIALCFITHSKTESNICKDVGITFDVDDHPLYNITKVNENGKAFIPCRFEYNPTAIIGNQDPRPTPFWRIQSHKEQRPRFYYPGRLPNNFNYNESLGGLTISNVDKSMDNLSVSCCFEFFDFRDICEASPIYIMVEREPNIVITTHVYSSSVPMISGNSLKYDIVSSILVAVIIVANLL